MDPVDPVTVSLALAPETLARWQFGVTTVYHYLFVPLTISLAAITAGLETAWVRTGKEKYFHATKFWGKLFLINIAMGVVTGIVQEFQFGMNWSAYSRFVGDVFGAPLAMEALLAFFFESTFIGLWIFGWDKLPKRIHCACIWIVAVGTVLSACFILAANSWMQHPVGFSIDEETGKAQLTDIVEVLTQNTAVAQYLHTLTAAFLTGGAFVVGISALHLLRARRRLRAAELAAGDTGRDGGATEAGDTAEVRTVERRRISVMRSSLRVGLVVTVLAGLGTAFSGDHLAKIMYEQQPMKMAAAEALWETEAPAPFSVFAVGDVSDEGTGHNKVAIELPGMLSFLAHSDFQEPVPGVNDIAERSAQLYGGEPGDYIPNIFITYWGFRLMIGFGMASFALGLAGLWLTRRKRWLDPAYRTGDDEVPRLMLTPRRELGWTLTVWAWRVAVLTMAFPLIANAFGWIFTEMGRQPWVVYGLMRTADAVSPSTSQAEVVLSLSVFSLLYAVLAVIEFRLLARYASAGPDTEEKPPPEVTRLRLPGQDRFGGSDGGSGSGTDRDPDRDAEDEDRPMTFAY